MKTVFKLLRILMPEWRWMLLGMLLMLFTIGSSTGLMYVGAYLITLAAMQLPLGALQLSIVGVRFFGTSKGFFRYAERIVSHGTTFKLLKDIRLYFYSKIEPSAHAVLNKFHSADLLRRLVGDIENLDNFYSRFILPLSTLFLAALIIACFLALVFYIPMLLVLLLLFCGFFIPLAMSFFTHNLFKDFNSISAQVDVMTTDIVKGYEDIIVSSAGERFFDSLIKKSEEAAVIERKTALLHSLFEGALLLAFYVFLTVIIYASLTGINNILIAAAVIIGSISLYEITEGVFSAFKKYSSALLSAKQIFNLIKKETPAVKTGIPEAIPGSYEIEFTGVSFNYSSDDAFCLNNITFKIPSVGVMLVSGESGSGKSTIGNLIMNFYEPSGGAITIGGVSVSKIGQYEMPRYVNLCEQKSHIFNESLLDNLLYCGKSVSDENILKTLEELALNEFADMKRLADLCGWELSVGQKKRLSIVRTILSEAPVMIFDEPFAGLDEESAEVVSHKLISLGKSRSIVIITHTLPKSCLNISNKILLKDGKRVEERVSEEWEVGR